MNDNLDCPKKVKTSNILQTFLITNWEKVIGLFFSIIIAGITGYFFGIISLRSELSKINTELNERLTRVETLLNEKVKPSMDMTIDHQNKITQLLEHKPIMDEMTKLIHFQVDELDKYAQSLKLNGTVSRGNHY